MGSFGFGGHFIAEWMDMGASILLVDDDDALRAMLGLSLRSKGYRLRLADSGARALEILRGESFDWLITDAKMDAMDGFELARKAKDLRSRLRILMVSAVSTDSDALDGHIEKVFPKPVPLEDLYAWLSSPRQDCCNEAGHDDQSHDLRRRDEPGLHGPDAGDLHQGGRP